MTAESAAPADGASPIAEDFAARRALHLVAAREWLQALPPDTWLSHWSAAVADGLPTYSLPQQIVATRRRGRPGNDDHHRLLVAGLRPGIDVVEGSDPRRTSVARTVVDLARRWPFCEALPTADAALRAGKVSRHQLEEMLRFQYNWPRIPRAMRVVAWASPLSESVLESFVRARIISLGLPIPDQQRNLGDETGQLGRSDFYWEGVRLVGEADGRSKYLDNRLAAWAEKQRQDALAEAGFSFIRWTWASAHAPDGLFAARLLSAIERAAIEAGVRDAITAAGASALTEGTGLSMRQAAACLARDQLLSRPAPPFRQGPSHRSAT